LKIERNLLGLDGDGSHNIGGGGVFSWASLIWVKLPIEELLMPYAKSCFVFQSWS
jgi:hypothetical protein